MELSSDQKAAATQILNWFLTPAPGRAAFITLGGYAGTGKTTLIAHIKKQINDLYKDKLKVAFCSYTGRAAQNLKQKLVHNKTLKSTDSVSTIHGLIYDPIENSKGEITGWMKKSEIDAELVIVDEASMIDREIWEDLLSYRIPILAVGDHGQLPPIRGDFNLMQKPQLLLEKIHRQAENNPIISVSIHARTTGKIPAKKYGERVIKYCPADFDFTDASTELLENYDMDTLILCGYNSTRTKINQFVRNSLGFETPEPQPGDRVICLRNNHKKAVYNGMLGTIINLYQLNENWYEAEIDMDDRKALYVGKIYAPQFGSLEPINFTKDRIRAKDGDLFDFGYALTVHKAQGSQAKRVILFEERFSKMDDDQWKRWLYTGITRAEEELFVFGG